MKSYVRKKVYLKKIGEINGFKFWYVNGFWIRNNIEPEFGNFGYSWYMPFIPKDEFWIDYESGAKKEAKYYIDNFLTIQREMKNGTPYVKAWKKSNRLEKLERGKMKFIEKIKKIKIKEKLLEKIHKKQLFTKYTNKLKIFQVRGDLVRSLFFIDYAAGGHEYVYNFVPKNEVWIDDDVYKKEIPYVLIHELHERYLMSKGWPYDPKGVGVFTRRGDIKGKSAHFNAEDIECMCRANRKLIKKTLLKEIKNNEASIKS
jgi:hypothetical protein